MYLFIALTIIFIIAFVSLSNEMPKAYSKIVLEGLFQSYFLAIWAAISSVSCLLLATVEKNLSSKFILIALGYCVLFTIILRIMISMKKQTIA